MLFHFLILSDFLGMMLGGSKSKLAKHGENLEKVMSGLFFTEGVGSALSVEIRSFVKFTRLIKVSCFKLEVAIGRAGLGWAGPTLGRAKTGPG